MFVSGYLRLLFLFPPRNRGISFSIHLFWCIYVWRTHYLDISACHSSLGPAIVGPLLLSVFILFIETCIYVTWNPRAVPSTERSSTYMFCLNSHAFNDGSFNTKGLYKMCSVSTLAAQNQFLRAKDTGLHDWSLVIHAIFLRREHHILHAPSHPTAPHQFPLHHFTNHMAASDFTLHHITSHDMTSHDMTGHCKTSQHMTWEDRKQKNTSHQMTWREMMLHHITQHDMSQLWQCGFTSRHLTTNHITSSKPATELMTSKHITSQHMTSSPRNGWMVVETKIMVCGIAHIQILHVPSQIHCTLSNSMTSL